MRRDTIFTIATLLAVLGAMVALQWSLAKLCDRTAELEKQVRQFKEVQE